MSAPIKVLVEIDELTTLLRADTVPAEPAELHRIREKYLPEIAAARRAR